MEKSYYKNLVAILTHLTGNSVKSFLPDLYWPTKLGISLDQLILRREISNLELRVELPNLPMTPFPEELTTQILTDFEKSVLLRNNEWKSTNRIEIEILHRLSEESAWEKISVLSLINRGSAYPHPGFSRAVRADENVLFLDSHSDMAIKVADVGAGLLRLGDRLIVTGFYKEILESNESSIPSITTCQNLSWSVSPSGIKLFTASTNRAFFRITNNGTFRIWVNLGQLDGVGKGDYLNPGNGRQYDMDSAYFGGEVWAICEGLENQPASGIICYK